MVERTPDVDRGPADSVNSVGFLREISEDASSSRVIRLVCGYSERRLDVSKRSETAAKMYSFPIIEEMMHTAMHESRITWTNRSSIVWEMLLGLECCLP